jgi:hypothetical protein
VTPEPASTSCPSTRPACMARSWTLAGCPRIAACPLDRGSSMRGSAENRRHTAERDGDTAAVSRTVTLFLTQTAAITISVASRNKIGDG